MKLRKFGGERRPYFVMEQCKQRLARLITRLPDRSFAVDETQCELYADRPAQRILDDRFQMIVCDIDLERCGKFARFAGGEAQIVARDRQTHPAARDPRTHRERGDSREATIQRIRPCVAAMVATITCATRSSAPAR